MQIITVYDMEKVIAILALDDNEVDDAILRIEEVLDNDGIISIIPVTAKTVDEVIALLT